MRLRHIETVSFRRSEMTNFETLLKEKPAYRQLRKNDVICLRSVRGDQLVFVHGFEEIGRERRCLRSVRLRLDHGGWNPLMLADYAKAAGLRLDGLPMFEEHLNRLLNRARQAFGLDQKP